MKRIMLIILCAAFSGFSLRCGLHQERPVAQVNNTKLAVDDLDMMRFAHIPDSSFTAALLSYVNQWIDQELLYQEAERQKIHLTPEMEAELDRVKKAMLVSLFLKENIEQIITVSDQEALQFYETHSDDFVAESHYFKFSALKVLTRNLEQIIDSETHNGRIIEYYEKYPDQCEIVSLGNEFVIKDDLIPEVAQVLEAQALTDQYVKSRINRDVYYIRIIDKVEEGSVKHFAMVESDIKSMLKLAKRQEKYDDLIGRLRLNIRNEVNIDILTNLRQNR
ncbi:hypothetical protein ACFL4Q_02460 [candidate division KSB1 bacterium]